MKPQADILRRIEELRRQLHQGLGSHYDPDRIQELAPISRELDRLVVDLFRRELNQRTESQQ